MCVLNALYRTDKGIHCRSTSGELRKAYKIMRVEPDKTQIIVVVDEVRADFSIAKSKLLPGWWNEKTKSVDLSRVPDTATTPRSGGERPRFSHKSINIYPSPLPF